MDPTTLLEAAISSEIHRVMKARKSHWIEQGRAEERKTILADLAQSFLSPGSVLKSHTGQDSGEGDPHDAIAEAMVEHAHECKVSGVDPTPGMEALRALLDDPEALAVALQGSVDEGTVAKAVGMMVVRKAWSEDTHPRDDSGRFVSNTDIRSAKDDPKKREELLSQVTDPEQREKLESLITSTSRTGGHRFIGDPAKIFHKEEGHQHTHLIRGNMVAAIKAGDVEKIYRTLKIANKMTDEHYEDAKDKAWSQFFEDYGGGTTPDGRAKNMDFIPHAAAVRKVMDDARDKVKKAYEDWSGEAEHMVNGNSDRDDFDAAQSKVREAIDQGQEEIWNAVEAARNALGGKEKGYKLGRYFKAWDASAHPRGRGGHFISKDAIEEAKSDPEKAKALRAQVKPEDAAKLDKQLAAPAKTPGVKAQRAVAKDRGAELLAKLGKSADLRGKLTADDLHALADHLSDPAVTVAHLREVRQAMRDNALKAGFGGGKRKEEMVRALVEHARGHAFVSRLKEQGIAGEGADEMRRAAGRLPKEVEPDLTAKPTPAAIDPIANTPVPDLPKPPVEVNNPPRTPRNTGRADDAFPTDEEFEAASRPGKNLTPPAADPALDMGGLLDQSADAVAPGSRTGEAVARAEGQAAKRTGVPELSAPVPVVADATPGSVSNLPAADFAKVAQSAADEHTHGFGSNRVFIADVYDKLKAQDPSLTEDHFRDKLREASQAGHLSLSRADLVQLMDPDTVRRSEMDRLPGGAPGGQAHFLLAKEKKREQRANPTWQTPANKPAPSAAVPPHEDVARATNYPKGLGGVLDIHRSATGKAKDAIDAALWNAGVEDPAGRSAHKTKVDPAKLARTLAGAWHDMHDDMTPQERDQMHTALAHAGVQVKGTQGEQTTFDGRYHEGAAGHFTGDKTTVTRPGLVHTGDDGVERVLVKGQTEKGVGEQSTLVNGSGIKRRQGAAGAEAPGSVPGQKTGATGLSPPSSRHREIADGWVAKSPHLPPHLKEHFAAHTAHVLDRMPAGCRKAAMDSIEGGGSVSYHGTLKEIKAAAERITGKKVSGTLLGFVHTKRQYGDPIPGSHVNLDGGKDTGEKNDDTAAGTTAHEMGHAVDFDGKYSNDAAWKSAWKREIFNGKTLLSRYARTDESEGFAELHRVIVDKGIEATRERFPKCVAFLESKGLL